MALTKEQFQELRNKGLSVEQIVKFESGEKPKQGFRDRAVAPYVQRQKETMRAMESGEQGFASSAFQTGANVIGAGVAPFTEAIKTVTPEPVRKGIESAFSATVGQGVLSLADRISDIKAVQRFASSKTGETTSRNVEAIPEYLNLIPVPKGVKAVGVGGEKVLSGIDTASEAIKYAMTPTEKVVDDFILKNYTKAIKPTVVGKKTLGNLEKSQQQAVRAVKLIEENKDTLKFTDEAGVVITGRNPENIMEFADAVGQTKSNIYKKYSDIAKNAGEQGVVLDVMPIVNELDVVINNKALRLSHPEAVQYAKSVKDRYMQEGTIDAETAQELIKNYNSSLESFYRNPNYDNASKAAIDAALVNNLRKSLDDVIEKTTGEQYQALKNDYASMKAIENDVVKRATVEARKQAKGLIDYTDIFSGGDIVSGVLTLNPALFARGVAQKSIKEYLKMLNDPNRAIRRMFEEVGKETRPLPVISDVTQSQNP